MVKKFIILTIIFLTNSFLSSCSEESEFVDEYVFSVQLVNDPIKIREYLDYHKAVWPEVEKGFKEAGYHSIRLYRHQNYLTMVIKVPKGTDLDKIGATKELNTEKVKVWNSLMTTYQKNLPGTPEGTTWVRMHKFYEFENNK